MTITVYTTNPRHVINLEPLEGTENIFGCRICCVFIGTTTPGEVTALLCNVREMNFTKIRGAQQRLVSSEIQSENDNIEPPPNELGGEIPAEIVPINEMPVVEVVADNINENAVNEQNPQQEPENNNVQAAVEMPTVPVASIAPIMQERPQDAVEAGSSSELVEYINSFNPVLDENPMSNNHSDPFAFENSIESMNEMMDFDIYDISNVDFSDFFLSEDYELDF